MSERSETLPARSGGAAQLLPGDAIVVHRTPLTVVVAVDGEHATVAPVVTAMVDHLIESGQWSFGPVAEALQSFVVSHQPVGVAAVLDVEPDPIAFLFDRAVVFEPTDTHRGDGRSGWTTVFVSGPQVVVAAGDDNLDGPSAPGWSRLIAGTVAGGGIRLSLDASPTETQPQAEAVPHAAPVEDESAMYEPVIDASAVYQSTGHESAGHESASDQTMVDESAVQQSAIDQPVVDQSGDPGTGADRFTELEVASADDELGGSEPGDAVTVGLRFDPFSPDESFFRSTPAGATTSSAPGQTDDGEPLDGSEPRRQAIGEALPADGPGHVPDGYDLEAPPQHDPIPALDQETVTETWLPDDQPTAQEPEHFDRAANDDRSAGDDRPAAQDQPRSQDQRPWYSQSSDLDRGPSELEEAPSPAATAAAATVGPTSGPLDDIPPIPPADALLARPEPSTAVQSPIGQAEQPSTQQRPPLPDEAMRSEPVDASSGTDGPLTGQPPTPAGPLAGQPPTPDGPQAGQPPMPNGPQAGQPPMPNGPQAGQPPMPNGPQTGQPPMPEGPRAGQPPMPNGPQTGQPPMPDRPLAGQPPMPEGPRAGQPPMPDGPQTGQPPAEDGPVSAGQQAGQPPMPDGPRAGQPPMPDGPQTGQPPAEDGPVSAGQQAGQPPMPDGPPPGQAPPMPPPDAFRGALPADQPSWTQPPPPSPDDRVVPPLPDQFPQRRSDGPPGIEGDEDPENGSESIAPNGPGNGDHR